MSTQPCPRCGNPTSEATFCAACKKELIDQTYLTGNWAAPPGSEPRTGADGSAASQSGATTSPTVDRLRKIAPFIVLPLAGLYALLTLVLPMVSPGFFEEREIRGLLDRQIQYLNTGDTVGLASTYPSDDPIRGALALAGSFQSTSPRTEAALEDFELVEIRDGYAFGRVTMLTRGLQSGAPTYRIYSEDVFVKERTGWKSLRSKVVHTELASR